MKDKKGGVAIDSIILTIVRVITALIAIVISKLLTVYFSVEEYGIYSQAMLLVTTGTSVTILGLTDAVNYYFNKENDEKERNIYIATIFGLQFIIGGIFAFSCFIFSNQISSYFGNSDIVSVIPFIAFLPMFTNLMNMLQILFVSAGQAKTLASRNFIISIIKIIYVFIVCSWIKNITYILLCLFIVEMLTTIYMWIYVKKNIINIELLKSKFIYIPKILNYSIPMAGYIVTNALSRSMDKWVIARMSDSSSLAIYSVASKELPFDLFTAAFVTVLIPFITKYINTGNNKGASIAFSKYIQLSYLITWPLALGAIVFSNDLMLILYDEKYLVGIWIFIIYIGVDMIRFANVSLIFSAKAKTKELLFYSSSALLLNIILNISLYNWLGMVGPAIATVLIMVIVNSIMLIRSSALLKSSVLDIINYKLMLSLIIELIIVGGISYFISNRVFYGLNLVVRFGVSYSVFLIPIFLINYRNILNILKELNGLKK